MVFLLEITGQVSSKMLLETVPQPNGLAQGSARRHDYQKQSHQCYANHKMHRFLLYDPLGRSRTEKYESTFLGLYIGKKQPFQQGSDLLIANRTRAVNISEIPRLLFTGNLPIG